MTIDEAAISEVIELGDVIVRGYRRLTVIAFTGDDERVWVCDKLDHGLVKANAFVTTLEPTDKLDREAPRCECGCGERVRSRKQGIWSRWAPGHWKRGIAR